MPFRHEAKVKWDRDAPLHICNMNDIIDITVFFLVCSMSLASVVDVFKSHPLIWVFPKIMIPPKSAILIGVSIINHPFWGTPIFGNIHIPLQVWLMSFAFWAYKGWLQVAQGSMQPPFRDGPVWYWLMLQKSSKVTSWDGKKSHYLQGVLYMSGGWEWDFWTINSLLITFGET